MSTTPRPWPSSRPVPATAIVARIQQEIAIVGFWDPHRSQAREGLRSWIVQVLDAADVLPFTRLEAVADRLMELAKANHHRLGRVEA